MEIQGGNPGVTWLLLVLDTSGSMAGQWAGVQEGVTAMLKEQEENGHDEVYVGLVSFDYHARIDSQPVPIMEFPKKLFFHQGGSTALFDGVYTSITNATQMIAKLPPELRPGRVITMVQTDGGENGSRVMAGTVEKLVQQKEKEGWEFVYVGLDPRAVQGKRLGIERRAQYFGKHPKQMVAFLSALSVAIRCGHDVPRELLPITHFGVVEEEPSRY